MKSQCPTCGSELPPDDEIQDFGVLDAAGILDGKQVASPVTPEQVPPTTPTGEPPKDAA